MQFDASHDHVIPIGQECAHAHMVCGQRVNMLGHGVYLDFGQIHILDECANFS